MKWTDILSWLFNVHKKIIRPVDHRHPLPNSITWFLEKKHIYAIENNNNTVTNVTGLQNGTFPPMVSIV